MLLVVIACDCLYIALSNEEDMLVSQLFSNYNRNVKPTRKATGLVNVLVSYKLFKISGIVSKSVY